MVTTSVEKKLIHTFGFGEAEGDTSMKALLGGKGADLCEMSRIGLPVPPGFIVTTEAHKEWLKGVSDGVLQPALSTEVADGIRALEEKTGRAFGGIPPSGELPLLVSVRSGAPISMPGMMDTVLNLGLARQDVAEVADVSGKERLVWDAWRRFLQMYGSVVLGMDDHVFDEVLGEARGKRNVADDSALDADAFRGVANQFEELIVLQFGGNVRDMTPIQQLEKSIAAVFGSWNGEPARVYRNHHNIPDDLGTAVNVQAMVYGNAGDRSASGVLFTRNPATGERVPYGEYLMNAQGEDVVSGMRTPQPVSESMALEGEASLESVLPDSYRGLVEVIDIVEKHYRDVQDMEFCIEEDHLWMLQTRTAKRTVHAAVKNAVDMVGEGLIERREALMRVAPDRLGEMLLPQFLPGGERRVIATGLPASPGGATGVVSFNAGDVVERVEAGQNDNMVRGETSATDIAGMIAAEGVLTARGGATSHAAVVARGLGRPCVTACSALVIDDESETMKIGELAVNAGDSISIDGTTGEVILGEIPVVAAAVSGELDQLLTWADEVAALEVRANADDGESAARARNLGARGIGLCRTEHMFFAKDRLPLMVETILASDQDEARGCLEKLSPAIEEDFRQMFESMDGLPVTIRLLDPPLHEFLPGSIEEAHVLASSLGIDADKIFDAAEKMQEDNPMLGLRGARLAMVSPVICEMQARWVVRAAVDSLRSGVSARPAIMVPLVMNSPEYKMVKQRILEAINDELAIVSTGKEIGWDLKIPVGTMLELPSACVLAGSLAGDAEFFSFGTNDLTQMTYGLSRDDAEAFLPAYVEEGVFPADPFITLDDSAVGELMRIAVTNIRAREPQTEIGACGEHAGDSASIARMMSIGLDYVSCSPPRVPAARLAAAQAVLRS